MTMPTIPIIKRCWECVSDVFFSFFGQIKSNSILATALTLRYEQAAEMFQEVQEYFDNMTSSIDKEDIEMWKAEIIDAENQCLQTPGAMDIMGVRPLGAPDDVRVSTEELLHNDQGDEWISLALTVEERQYVDYQVFCRWVY